MSEYIGQARSTYEQLEPQRELGVAELTQEAVSSLHQTLTILDTLIDRIAGPQPEVRENGAGKPGPIPHMGVRQLAQVSSSLAAETVRRAQHIANLI